MKRVIVFIILFFGWINVYGQIKYAYVDISRLIKDHPLKPYYDSIYNNYIKIYEDSVEMLMIEFNRRIYDDYPSPENIKDIRKNQRNKKELDDFYTYMTNQNRIFDSTMVSLKMQPDVLIKNMIIEKIKQYCSKHDYEIVMDRMTILYSKSGADITDKILEEILEE